MPPYRTVLFVTCIVVGIQANRYCDYWTLYDFPGEDFPNDDDFRPATKSPRPQMTTGLRVPNGFATRATTTERSWVGELGAGKNDQFDATEASGLRISSTTTSGKIPPLATIITRIGSDLNTVQQTQTNELYCLEVLDELIASRWQEDIDRISVNDLGNFSTEIPVPGFDSFYSNPESEWIQKEGTAAKKLDRCVRNLVSKIVPRMDRDEVKCLNKMWPSYLKREMDTATKMEVFINVTSREQLPFKTFFSYFELVELLLSNKNVDALDDEQRALHEDLIEFYIKSEEDKERKMFVIEQECQWQNARVLREVSNENARYAKFGEQVKMNVNKYLFAEILRHWTPGTILPEYKYDVWSKARQAMEKEIREKVKELQQEKRDAQFLCTYASDFATKFYTRQREILFDKGTRPALSNDLKSYKKYSYVAALEELPEMKKNELRRAPVSKMVTQYREELYCLTSFVRMVENHQRYMIATAFLTEMLPYGNTFCHSKDSSGGLVNPRYCRCQGTFCEVFGLATLRAERYDLELLPNGTYKVSTKASYASQNGDEKISEANERIRLEKFNTWWYNRQRKP